MGFLWSRRARMLEIFVLTVITIFGIGSQYFSNLAYSLNQDILQTSFGTGSQYLIIPSVIANFAFTFGIPLGHVFTHRLGFKKNYLLFVSFFLIGSIIGLISQDLIVLSIAKIIQSVSTGVLFFTLLPQLFRNFPRRFRNVFLLFVIVGLFGANALGGLSGSVSLELDSWHWVFVLNIVSAIVCLIFGTVFLNKEEHKHVSSNSIDYVLIILLFLTILCFVIPMAMLTQKGYSSLWVWPFLLLAMFFLVNFIYRNMHSSSPLVYFKTLFAKKPSVGAVMAISSHLTLLTGIAGINVFLTKILKLPFEDIARFYVCFFIGVVIAGFIKMFFYSAIGAGILGSLGSVALLYVSVHWIAMGNVINLPLLYLQAACLGFGASMALLSGAMATLLDGEIKFASNRSTTMHSMRNFFAALLVPIIAYTMKDHIQQGVQLLYGSFTTHIDNPVQNQLILSKKMQDITIDADDNVFMMMIVFNIILLIASIIQMFLGKGRRIHVKPE